MAVIILLAVGAFSYSMGGNALAKYIMVDYAPDQPIDFSHKIHTGDNEIPCRYCHIYARRSKVSGLPSIERCMGCHKSIRRDRPEIKKLTRYWENKEPISWVKVYDVPDYVYFTHKRHIKAGMKCQECHGDVQDMAKIEKVNSLTMGWCLGCHKERNGPIDCWECHV